MTSPILTNSSRSGIGNADLLKKYDIEPLVDLPGVGENYMGMTAAASGFSAR